MQQPISNEALSELVGSIYDCAIDPARWPETLVLMGEKLGFRAATLGLYALPSGKFVLDICTGIEEPWLTMMKNTTADAVEDWGGESVYRNFPMQEPAVRSRVSPYARTGEESRFIREWARPQGLIDNVTIIVARDASLLGAVTFGRHESQGPVGEREIELARLLIPHLQRAVTITQMLDYRTAEAATFEAVIDQLLAPVFLIAADMKIVHANRAARALLETGDFLEARGGALAPRALGVAAALETAIAQAAADESGMQRKGFGIPAQSSGGEPRALHVLPLRFGGFRPGIAPSAVAAVFVAPTPVAPTDRDLLTELFGLTQAEARVLERIAAGRTVADAAAELDIAPATVKTHLLRLFEKTGVNRQADLAALASSFALPAGG